MTIPSSSRGKRSGAIRSSTASSSLTVLVMSGDGERRSDWAEYFGGLGLQTMRCAGPQATTCALSLNRRCPLHEEADFIIYDQESVTPELDSQVRHLPPEAPIAYARSERDARGRQFPVATDIFSGRRPER